MALNSSRPSVSTLSVQFYKDKERVGLNNMPLLRDCGRLLARRKECTLPDATQYWAYLGTMRVGAEVAA